MYKVVLFDGDGVSIKNHKYFSQRLTEDFNISPDKIAPFVKEDLNKCFEDKADLKNILPKYIKEWGISKSVDELLQYWFEGENEPNTPVLGIVSKLRTNGIRCYITSDNEKYRGKYIKNTMKYAEFFDDIFFSYSLGMKKSNKLFFETVINRVGCEPKEILHWDDDAKYTQIANEAEIDSRHFINTEDFINQMKNSFNFL